jgi:streptothricin acetyltransferase
MIEIKPLQKANLADFERVIFGYSSAAKYVVDWDEDENGALIRLNYSQFPTPYIKKFDHVPEESRMLRRVLRMNYSYGAFSDDYLVGLGIAEPRLWNQSLWVWEFHIDQKYQGMGIGSRLMEALASKAKETGLRTIICETQNTNVPAIRFYRKMGFHLEGVDISYYTNQDYPDGEIAFFMKKRI